MAIVDERGRLGGTVNLIDAVVAFLILILIPVAFGAYLLFRTPAATLTAINPATLHQGPNMRIEVQGENLRPFMRVAFNDLQGKTYEIQSTRGAMVDLPDLGAGTYDVVLYDHQQEVSRLKKALTVLPLAPVSTVDMVVIGSFKGLSADRVSGLKPGDKLNTFGTVTEVLSVGTAVESAVTIRTGGQMLRVPMTGKTDLPATLKVGCFVISTPDGALKCAVPGPNPGQESDIAPGATLSLAAPAGWATFQIDEIKK